MPVYNAGEYLREAIESILNQTYRNFVFLIINDGSTDQSEAIIKSYTDERIWYVKNEENLRLVASLNKGLDMITTKYMVRMDADDISDLTRLEKLRDFMEKNPDVGICGSYIKTFGADNSIWEYNLDDKNIRAGLMFKSMMPHAASMFKMELFNRNNIRYKEKFLYFEDKVLWIDLFRHTRFANLPEPLFLYRIYPESSTQANKTYKRSILKAYFTYLFEKLEFDFEKAEVDAFFEVRIDKQLDRKRLSLFFKMIESIRRNNADKKLFDEAALNAQLRKMKKRVYFEVVKKNLFALGFYCLRKSKAPIKDYRYLMGGMKNYYFSKK